jgi:hypothetical protein
VRGEDIDAVLATGVEIIGQAVFERRTMQHVGVRDVMNGRRLRRDRDRRTAKVRPDDHDVRPDEVDGGDLDDRVVGRDSGRLEVENADPCEIVGIGNHDLDSVSETCAC